MYRDFEDLRDNCPVSLRADIAIDLTHDDPERMAELWPATTDGGFRLALTDAVTGFWEDEVRRRAGGKLEEDALAIEIMVDAYTDPEMGSFALPGTPRLLRHRRRGRSVLARVRRRRSRTHLRRRDECPGRRTARGGGPGPRADVRHRGH